jgi:beta-mannosidase
MAHCWPPDDPDPFFGMNETAVQWVGERTWVWRHRFDVAELSAHEGHLVFAVWTPIAPIRAQRRAVAAVDEYVRATARRRAGPVAASGSNELLLRFDPPLQAPARKNVFASAILWNGDSARLYARKAQYHFGWDWGPVLLTSGRIGSRCAAASDVRIAEIDCPPAGGGGRAKH